MEANKFERVDIGRGGARVVSNLLLALVATVVLVNSFNFANGIEDHDPEMQLMDEFLSTGSTETLGNEPGKLKLMMNRIIDGRFYERQYDKFNEYLVEELPDSTDLDANLEKLTELYEKKKASKGKGMRNSATVVALEQVLALKKIGEDFKCNSGSFDILVTNDLATRGKAHRHHVRARRRIESVVHQALMRHAELCKDFWPAEYSRLWAESPDKELFAMAQMLTNTIILSKKRFRLPGEQTLMEEHRIPLDVYRHLNDNVPKSEDDKSCLKMKVNERDGKLRADSECVQRLVAKYVTSPCKSFMDTFERSIFLPSFLDRFMSVTRVYGYQDLSEQEKKFQSGRDILDTCRKFSQMSDREVSKMVLTAMNIKQ